MEWISPSHQGTIGCSQWQWMVCHVGEETSPRSFAKVANFVGLGGPHQVGFNLGFKGGLVRV